MDRPAITLIAALLGVLALSSLVWMLQGIGCGNRGFILQLRGTKLAGLVVVGAAIGTATVLFQTVAANRVLTEPVLSALYNTPVEVSRHDGRPLVQHHHWHDQLGAPCPRPADAPCPFLH